MMRMVLARSVPELKSIGETSCHEYRYLISAPEDTTETAPTGPDALESHIP